MTWTLLIVALGGSAISSNTTFVTMQMKSREACMAALTELFKGNKWVSKACISSETGEVVGK